MRAFLLGTLDGDHKTQFEERILSEPGVYEELLVVEEELIEQYLAGDLSALEQEQFESHFLITAERQKNLRYGKLLQQYAADLDLTERENLPFRFHRLTSLSRFCGHQFAAGRRWRCWPPSSAVPALSLSGD